MNHKIVCWGDYAIPVPKDANWIAMDKDGEFLWFKERPMQSRFSWSSYDPYFDHTLCSALIEPPEPGPWTEQLYWIGD